MNEKEEPSIYPHILYDYLKSQMACAFKELGKLLSHNRSSGKINGEKEEKKRIMNATEPLQNFDIYTCADKTVYSIRDGKIVDSTTFEQEPFVIYLKKKGCLENLEEYQYLLWPKEPFTPSSK